MEKEWRDIPGFGGMYQISQSGEVRNVRKHGKFTIRKPYYRRVGGKKISYIKFQKNGKKSRYWVIQLVALAFLGPCPQGYMAYFKDSGKQDESLDNIHYIKISEYKELAGKRDFQRPVLKIDREGNVAGSYPSARECSRNSEISFQAINGRCNGMCKSVFAPDGYAYAWADDPDGVREMMEKIEAEKRKERS